MTSIHSSIRILDRPMGILTHKMCRPMTAYRRAVELTVLRTVVQGKGTLSFSWKVSSESSYDRLHFIVDGSEVSVISGEGNWATVTHDITSDGSHTIEWKYDKDSSVSNGSDCGWVDEVDNP